jgi:hypothetical protein
MLCVGDEFQPGIAIQLIFLDALTELCEPRKLWLWLLRRCSWSWSWSWFWC